MIYDGTNNHKEISRIVINGKDITSYYTVVKRTLRLIWEGIKSCFGNGFWINDKPWNNNESWKN